MTLQQCTKADLLWVIDRACKHNLSDWAIKAALDDLELEKIRKLTQFANEKRMEYIDLMKPYDGWKFIDIPLDVLKKAQAALKQAEEAERKWAKLMGLQK